VIASSPPGARHHGEEPHTVGSRSINVRRAASLDPNCGWAHGKADVLYVADAFKVMARVNELLAAGFVEVGKAHAYSAVGRCLTR